MVKQLIITWPGCMRDLLSTAYIKQGIGALECSECHTTFDKAEIKWISLPDGEPPIRSDIPRDKLLAIFQAYVAQATAIVREQERLIDQIRGEAVDSPLIQRALEAVAKVSNAILEQDALVRELNQRGNGIKSAPENGDSGP
jgi:hypothetical protein